ncbi:MAG: hypothetical protein RL131_955 [Bacteroidota bacterium]|jgi:hypothetical protein
MKQSNSFKNLKEINLIALTGFYVAVFVTLSLLQKFSSPSPAGVTVLNTMASLIQAPFLLIILSQFSQSKKMSNGIGLAMVSLLAFFSGAIASKGIGEANLLNMMMVSMIPVFGVATIHYANQMKAFFNGEKNRSKLFLLAGIVLGTGTLMAVLVLNFQNPGKHASDIREILGMITVLAAVLMSIGLIQIKIEFNTEMSAEQYASPEQAGLAQWEDFSLSSTPDVIKKGVTDISKYYRLQKAN